MPALFLSPMQDIRRRSLLPAASITPVLFLILLVGIAPFLEALRGSFFHDSYGEVSFAGLANYRYIFSDAAFGYSLNITVLWGLLNVLLSLVFGFFIALGLVSEKRGHVHRFLLMPMAIPVYIAIPLWRAFLHGNGGESIITRFTGLRINLLMDPAAGFLGSLAVSLWLSIPLTAFVLAGHMRKVNRQVLEAARMDGAGPGHVAMHIYLPEIRDSLAAMGILNFIKAFKEFTLVFMMTAGGPPLVSGITDRHIVGATTTMGVFLYEVFLHNPDWGVNAAYSVVMASFVLLVMLVWIFMRRENPRRPLLLLLALILIPGGDYVLWTLAAGYAVLSFLPTARRSPFLILGGIQLGYTLARVLTGGYLIGFHPAVMLTLFIWLILYRKPLNPTKAGSFRWGSAARGISAAKGSIVSVFILLTAVILYMLLWMSLSRISACYIDSVLPSMPTGGNFTAIFADEGIGRYFLNTFIVAGVTAVLLPPVIFPAAVYLNRKGRKYTLAFLGVVQIVGIAGGMHTLIPLYSIFRTAGLVNTWVPLILIYLYHGIPFSLFILTAYFRSLPGSFRDLAKMEGMGDLVYGFRILLPLSLPQLFTAVMMAFIAGWNGFQAPLLFLNEERLYTISLKLFSWVGSIGSGGPLWNLFAAASVVNTFFIGALFLRFRKPMGQSALSDFDE